MEPEKQWYRGEVNYDGNYEAFDFNVIGNSPDLKGDTKNQYKELRKKRGQGWDRSKYKFVGCNPI